MASSTVTRAPQVYRLADGMKVPGVTSILSTIAKPALPVWANRLGFNRVNSTEHLRYLADAGTLAHSLIAQQLGGPAADYAGYTPDQVTMAERALSGFYSWSEGKALESRELELGLVSETHGYGGTLDFLGLVGGELTVCDWKTSSAIYNDHCYQISAYYNLLTEAGYEVDAARIVRLSRDEAGEWSERCLSVLELELFFAVFKAAMDLYNAIKQANGRPR